MDCPAFLLFSGMMFLIIFAVLLGLFFGIVDPLLKKHKLKMRPSRGFAFFDLIGIVIETLKFW